MKITAIETLQLDAYRGYRTYLFDGPHYVPPQLVDSLLQ